MNAKRILSSWPGAAMLLAILLVYWPAVHGGWIWDDYLYLVQNLGLRTVKGLKQIWMRPPGLNYFPVTETLQWLQWQCWGDHPFGYHLTNLVLHWVNCLLLWKVLGRLGAPLPWIAGLLFALHPVTVESVAWISELKNVLSTALLFGALDAYLDFDANDTREAYLRSWLLFVAALLSKSTVVMFPVCLLLYALWRRRRLESRDVWLTVPFFLASLASGLVTIWFEHHRAMLAGFSSTAQAATGRLVVVKSAIFYLRAAVWPAGILANYPKSVLSSITLIELLACALLAGIVLRALARRQAWAQAAGFGLGWFFINLLPILGFIPMAYQRIAPVADHFAYLALPGVLALVAAGIARLKPRLLPIAAAAAIGLALGSVSEITARSYRDETTFWNDILARNPESWLAHNQLGVLAMRQGDLPRAQSEFRRSLQIAPGYVEAHNNFGVTLQRTNQLSAAVLEFEQALRLRPNGAEAKANLASAYAQIGNLALQNRALEPAIAAFAQSLELDPAASAVHNNLGIALMHANRLPEAIRQLQAALNLKPAYPEALTNLANAQARSGQWQDAVNNYRAALKLEPSYAPAKENLAYVLGRRSALSSPSPTQRETSPTR